MAIGSSQWMYNSGASAYEIGQSLRFEDGSSTTLTRTPASSGNRKTWTFSVWFKLGNLTGASERILQIEPGNAGVYVTSTGQIGWVDVSASNFVINSDRLLRDTSAWYHLVLAFDSTQSTASNRLKAWLNGELIAFTNESGYDSYPSLNQDGRINSERKHIIGGYRETSQLWDGYLGEVNFIDGLAKVPADFGETGDYGEWKPKEYSGSYGTNGFYLNFAGGGIMSASGGNSTATDGDFKAASFTANGTFTPSADGYVEYLVIGGAGGGARGEGGSGGGGGAGGYRTGMLPVTGGTGYSITVGAGGSASNNGSSSVFSSITSTGGGAGSVGLDGASGGSGGGAAGQASKVGGSSSAYGNDGGDGVGSGNYGAGGGGGAGAAGADGTTTVGGNGGAGIASSITGSSVTRAGGGGGGTYNGGTAGTGGSGGGGNAGAAGTSNNAVAGTANTGSGGGGGSYQAPNWGAGGAGGSGIVILRYKFQ